MLRNYVMNSLMNCGFANCRGYESILKKYDKVYPKNSIICTIPEENKEAYELLNKLMKMEDKEIEVYDLNFLCKYKIGDGEHTWSELEYQPGMVPLISINPTTFDIKKYKELREVEKEVEKI